MIKPHSFILKWTEPELGQNTDETRPNIKILLLYEIPTDISLKKYTFMWSMVHTWHRHPQHSIIKKYSGGHIMYKYFFFNLIRYQTDHTKKFSIRKVFFYPISLRDICTECHDLFTKTCQIFVGFLILAPHITFNYPGG